MPPGRYPPTTLGKGARRTPVLSEDQVRPHAIAETNAGAVAFSRTGDPNTGEFSDAVILASYGEVDHNMLGE